MAKRMILMLAEMALVIGGLGFVKFRQIKAAMAAGGSFTPPPEAVTTTTVKQEQWPATLNGIGSVVAVRGVTVAADLPGIVDKIEFESGNWVKEGDVLVRLDTRQERAQLAEAEAQVEWARVNYGRVQELSKQGVIARQEADRTIADQKSAEAKVAEMKATIDRKTIRAPFSGVLGIRQVNLGQYLAAGNPIVPLQSLDPIYVNFNLPQEAVSRLKVGQNVSVALKDGSGAQFTGRVTALDSVVDPSTRNVQVQATFVNKGGKLRPGMFVDTSLALGSVQDIATVPTSAVAYAPYGDSVFVVSDMKAPDGKSYKGVKQQFVKLGEQRGDKVAVLTGLKGGDEVVTSGTFKLRNGAAVQTNNTVQPSNSLQPQVEDR